jgi:hypothetical protein
MGWHGSRPLPESWRAPHSRKSGLLVLTRPNIAGSASRTNRILCNGSEVSCFSIHRRAFLAAYNDACVFPNCGVNVIVWECEIQPQCFTLIAVVLVISAIVLWPLGVLSILHITFLTWPIHWSDPEIRWTFGLDGLAYWDCERWVIFHENDGWALITMIVHLEQSLFKFLSG